MKSVDSQIEEIQEMMAAEDHEKYVKPIVIEHTPDGSKAQELLGGTLQIKAPWVDNGLERWYPLNCVEPLHALHSHHELRHSRKTI